MPLTPSTINSPSTSVTVEGVSADISPMKNRRFLGEIVDKSTTMDLIGFDEFNRSRLAKMKDQHSSIIITNCDIQLNSFTNRLEIVVKSYSKINPSQRDFTINDITTVGAPTISISDLAKVEVNTRINIRAKVIAIKEPKKVGKGKTKQEIVIADAKENCLLILWENDISHYADKLKIENSYFFTKMYVRKYRNEDPTISFAEVGSKIQPIDDIGVVNEVETHRNESTIEGATIAAVKDLVSFYQCPFCNGRMEPSATIATCTKCSAAMHIHKCKEVQMAKLILQTPSIEIITIVAYSDILKSIVHGAEVNLNNLLNAGTFTATYNEFNVVTSVTMT